jgi:hypothetical protein
MGVGGASRAVCVVEEVDGAAQRNPVLHTWEGTNVKAATRSRRWK